ncbi:DUF4397 domain-containing protein [Hymenobacter sp. 15J16-1T3B]|uniref:DUF4397 domain-containing protein n=1 Tax=Hymenobacter sp. 15J16-1T3B TaxID=2886941 RepID=UPI001D108297|nr:DUF4397 domain-containing protein [Hymenobacter sp. 15J16-1T3B]MCC3157776.1 DUF4397 domain-containing protein [Hymenobacter sp. 15J16-1T3B]
MNHPLKRFGHLLLLAAVPAAIFTSCGGDDDPDPVPVVDKGKVMAVHAVTSPSVAVKFLSDDTELKQLAYKEQSGYQEVNAGSHTFKIAVAATGGATLLSSTQTVSKDKSYSLFAYTATGQASNTATGLWVEDDLTAPSSGKAKIRLVNVGQGTPSPVGLMRTENSTTTTAVIPGTALGAASSFVEIAPGTATYYLVNTTTNLPVVPLAGSDKLTTNFAAGKIYTLYLRGSATPLSTTERFELDLVTHN